MVVISVDKVSAIGGLNNNFTLQPGSGYKGFKLYHTVPESLSKVLMEASRKAETVTHASYFLLLFLVSYQKNEGS